MQPARVSASEGMGNEMAKLDFCEVVGEMPTYLGELEDCAPFCVNESDHLRRGGAALPKVAGVYCFYENGDPLYVGRSRKIRKRVLQHRRRSSGHNAAQFAFNIARKKFEKNHPCEKLSREELSNNEEFANLFAAAKTRVRKMSVRFVKIKNPIEQTIFEVYAHMKLETPFNDFETH